MDQSRKLLAVNLPSATNNPDTLTTNLENQIAAVRLSELSEVRDHFICSFLGLVPKSNGTWRKIHHLSYPYGRSVNCHIPKEWRALEYTTFNEAKLEVIRTGSGSIMVKRDLRDAFWHIFVNPQDWCLLGFSWNDKPGLIDSYLLVFESRLPYLTCFKKTSTGSWLLC